MTETIELVEVPWYIPPKDEFDMPSYRTCDFCYGSAVEDALAGKSSEEFRTFFMVKSGNDDGLTVCEHCIDDFLKEGAANSTTANDHTFLE